MNNVTVQCPATVANLVCGFDILGMALQAPFDLMEVRLLDEPNDPGHQAETDSRFPQTPPKTPPAPPSSPCWKS